MLVKGKATQTLAMESVLDAEEVCQLGGDADCQRMNQTHDPFLSMPLGDGDSGKALIHKRG